MTEKSTLQSLADIKKTNDQNRCFSENFEYSHENPYHEKLEEFSHFVLRDKEAETFPGKWNPHFFKREAPLHVEIGSGYGDFMASFCQQNPEINFVGMDYRFKRSYQVARKLSQLGVNNFCYLRAKGERLSFMFKENEVDVLYLFFPDPWPKARHHKKRLFQLRFLQQAYHVLKPGGRLLIKSDHDGLYEWMKVHLNEVKSQLFHIEMETEDLYRHFPQHFLSSFQTKFEKIFISQHVKIKAFELTSCKK